MLKNNIKDEDITVVVQGSIKENKDTFPSKDYIFKCVDSIKIFLPGSKIILSTWEGEMFLNIYNLLLHSFSFGLTENLLNLYDIQLVSDYEFDYFRHNFGNKRDTFALNRYNAKQSIVVNFLRKNGKL